MSDDEIKFPPAEKRECKPFEPPPWEQDAFDEMARLRTEQAESAQAASTMDAAVAGAAPTAGVAAGVVPGTESGAVPVGAPGATAMAAAPAAPDAELGAERTGASAGEEAGKLDEARMAELFANLAAEESKGSKDLSWVGLVAGGVLLAAGALLMIWSVAALGGTRNAGWIGPTSSMGLGLFGMLFGGIGAWLLYKSLKRRGVL